MPSRAKIEQLVGQFLDEKRAEQARLAARPRRRYLRHLTLAVLSAASLAIWFVPVPTPSATTAELRREEGGRRMRLYLASLRVRAYASSHQHLPHSLAEANIIEPGLWIQSLPGDAFVIRDSTAPAIAFDSRATDSSFAGSAARPFGGNVR